MTLLFNHAIHRIPDAPAFEELTSGHAEQVADGARMSERE
jgi:hypothetical protein